MTTPKTIHYTFESLQEAVQCYHQSLKRLEAWMEKYNKYDFEIHLLTSGIKRQPTVKITVIKHK